MKSYYNGKDNCNCSWHMMHYYDGRRIRENYVKVHNNIIQYVEFVLPGILETGINYKTAKKRLAAYEKRCTMRIG